LCRVTLDPLRRCHLLERNRPPARTGIPEAVKSTWLSRPGPLDFSIILISTLLPSGLSEIPVVPVAYLACPCTTDVLHGSESPAATPATPFACEPQFRSAHRAPPWTLGRSFGCPRIENYGSLLLLWKGITRASATGPKTPVLFSAAVSILNRTRHNRRPHVNYLSARAVARLARFVETAQEISPSGSGDGQIPRFARFGLLPISRRRVLFRLAYRERFNVVPVLLRNT